jgi:3-phenylpropionate/cinnamic acid dioxygenase small subunit
MTMTLQEISDRIEIHDLLVRYSHKIDTKDFDGLDEVFTPDAIIDYTAMGGAKGTLPEIKDWLKKAMAQFPGHQHMIANSMIELHGDTATGRTMCHNPMVLDRGDGETHTFFCGLWYCDKLVRTPEGWRIQERVEEGSYFHNVPPDFQVQE